MPITWTAAGSTTRLHGFSYRYKVVRRSAPSHIEQVGAFDVRTTAIGRCPSTLAADMITDRQDWRDERNAAKQVSGRIDRAGFMRAATFLFDHALFDVSTRTAQSMPLTQYAQGFHAGVPPLGVSLSR